MDLQHRPNPYKSFRKTTKFNITSSKRKLQTMSSPLSPRTFTLFPKLPFELQDMIWEFTLSEPRLISGETCFREWWYGRIVRFLSPVALHVCYRSRSLAKRLLKRTSIQIPGVPGRKTLYLNQACDFFAVTKLDMQMNMKISRIVAEPALVNRVVISGIGPNEASPNMIHYFDHLSGLQEVILTDRALLYLIYKRTFPGRKYCKASPGTSELVRRVQQIFLDENRQVMVSGCWFDRG